jgi:hypothetical protein
VALSQGEIYWSAENINESHSSHCIRHHRIALSATSCNSEEEMMNMTMLDDIE